MTGGKDAVARAVLWNNGYAAAHSCCGIPSKRCPIKVDATLMWRDRCNSLKNFGAPSADKSSEPNNFSSAHIKRNRPLAVVGTNQSGNAQSHCGIVADRARLIRFDTATHHESFNGIAVICSTFQDAGALAITQNHHAVCDPEYFIQVM
jgi:hypothetical protein